MTHYSYLLLPALGAINAGGFFMGIHNPVQGVQAMHPHFLQKK